MKKTIAMCWALLIFLFSSYVFAEEKNYLNQYSEDGNYFVDVYKVTSDGFQSREAHYHFAREELAQKKFFELSRIYKNKIAHGAFSLKAAPYKTFKLWEVTHDWSEDWEVRYSVWMKENLNSNFLFNHGIATDCADVPVAYRWIFSMLNGLPAGNTLAGSQILFTQDSAPLSWQKLPVHANWWENQRFLKAIAYIQDNTYTGSMFYDLYPVQIDSRAIAPGTVWLIKGQHAYNVGAINFNNHMWMKLYSSTTPRELRKLSVQGMDLFQPTFDQDGFQRHRWLKKVNDRWKLVSADEMPWHSLEQYAPDFAPTPDLFALVVFQKLSGKPANPSQWLKGLTDNLENLIKMRRDVVEDGYFACHPNPCPLGSDLYESHSTPSRDRRILETIQKIKQYIASNPGLGLEQEWNYFLDYWGITIYADEAHYLSMRQFVHHWESGYFNSDPNSTIEVRWGLVREIIQSPPDVQSESELEAAAEKINMDFHNAIYPEQMTREQKEKAVSKYSHLDPGNRIPDELLNQAIVFFDQNQNRFTNTSYMTVVNLKTRSYHFRFFLINMVSGSVEAYHTSHGEGSDLDDDGFAESFSNIVDSRMSSLGFIRTGEVYSGAFGRSIRLDGLSETNFNMRRRAIVLHGSDHIVEDNVIQALSQGCLAFDWSVKDQIIDKIQNGSLIFVGLSNQELSGR